MLQPMRTNPRTVSRILPRTLGTLLLALAPLACAGTREEPPAPPPPPVDPAAFAGPARSPAPEVDLNANLDAANLWGDAGGASENAPSGVEMDAASGGSDAAQVGAHKPKRGAN
jgi:hypothetical protein